MRAKSAKVKGVKIMMENFDALEKAIDEMGNYIDALAAENSQLKNDIAGLKNTLDDRNQEIAQLQQELQANTVKVNASLETTAAYEKRAEGLLARVRAMQQKKAEQAAKADEDKTEDFPQQLSLLDD